MTSKFSVRPATPEDAKDLAYLINEAGRGLPYYFWCKATDTGEDPWAYGESRARRDTGELSYKNAQLAITEDGHIAACMVSYPILEPASSDDYAEMPEIFIPLQELEDLAVGSFYISFIAGYLDYRGLGAGSHLLALLDKDERDKTLIAADSNSDAIRLYERLGFEKEDTRRMIKEDWQDDGESWILMRKKGS